jgi:hypothetical protein
MTRPTVSKRYPKPVPKIIADGIYDRSDFERAFSKEQREAMRSAGLRPSIMTDTGNEPHHYDGAEILAAMRRIAQQRVPAHVESETDSA